MDFPPWEKILIVYCFFAHCYVINVYICGLLRERIIVFFGAEN